MFGRKNDSSSLPKRTRRSPEIVLDVAREVAEGGKVEAIGDVGEREAATVPHLALARRAIGMGDIAFHTRLRDTIETIVDDDISLVEFHGAKFLICDCAKVRIITI